MLWGGGMWIRIPLGDLVEKALTSVGITSERVERWLGLPDCGCKERKEALNKLDAWARRVLSGETGEHLDQIIARTPIPHKSSIPTYPVEKDQT